MAKSKTNSNTVLLIAASFVWFLVVSYITATTQYQYQIADMLADSQGTSTQPESALSLLIVTITFMPSGLLLAYPYVMKTFKNYLVLRIAMLSTVIALALFIVFSWYNFYINFAK